MRTFMTTLCLALVALSGCGAEEAAKDTAKDVQEALDPVAEAAAKTTEQGGARIVSRIDTRFEGVEVPMVMDGAVDFEGDRMGVELDYAPEGIDGVDAKGMAQARREADFPVQMIQAGDVVLVKTPSIRRKSRGEKEWAKVDLAEVDEEAGLDLVGASQISELNPEAFLRFLMTAGGSREAGHELLDGVRTTRYTGTMDIRRYPDTVPPERREAAERTVKVLEEAWGSTKEDYTVWIDEQGIVRRERVKLTIADKEGRMKMDMDMRFKDVGRPHEVAMPDDAEVVDITDQAVEELGG
jgi:hypothetical protein